MHKRLHAFLEKHALNNSFVSCRSCVMRNPCLKAGSLILHESTLAMGHILLGRRKRETACFILLEYALPERNLFIPGAWLGASIEFGKKSMHRDNFQTYMQAGGLEGALCREHVLVQERKVLAMGMAMLVKCRGELEAD